MTAVPRPIGPRPGPEWHWVWRHWCGALNEGIPPQPGQGTCGVCGGDIRYAEAVEDRYVIVNVGPNLKRAAQIIDHIERGPAPLPPAPAE